MLRNSCFHIPGQKHPVHAGHSLKYGYRRRKAVCSEEHPTHNYSQKCQRSGADSCHCTAIAPTHSSFEASPCMVHHQVDTVEPTPDGKGPACSVPKPAEEHGDHQVHVTARPAFAAPAQGDVKVVAQEARKRHV